MAARIAPPPIIVEMHPTLDTLPFFNPDLDRGFDDPALPKSVGVLRAAIAASDAVLISSPEYAHGVSGMLKNALDWLVGGPEMIGKRVALINTAPYATHAITALAETLRTMSVTLVDEASVAIVVQRNQDDAVLARDPSIVGPLSDALRLLASHSTA